MIEFKALRKNLKKDYSNFTKVKVAIVADWAIQMLAQALRGYSYEKQLDIEIYEATYDQMEPELLNPESNLYKFEPDYIVLFPCAEKFHAKYQSESQENRINLWQSESERIQNLCLNIKNNSDAKVLLSNYCELFDGIYGNYAATYTESYVYNQRLLNENIAKLVGDSNYIYLLDILSLQLEYGRKNIFDDKLYYLSKTVFAIDFLPVIAENIIKIINILKGSVKKCIVCDLDNTLWGGVIGDDGIEGIEVGSKGLGQVYSDIQSWVKELSQRGIAVAICSKNNEDTAKEPFNKHKEMILSLNDISLFIANWDDKATNIRKIQKILNIGMDSIVFIDDNPFERNLVKEIIPEITVPDLPKDPALYLSFLKSLNLFETVKISDTDKKRTQQYREEASRNEVKLAASNFDEYLKGLEMKAVSKPFDSFSLPRVAQLSQRSNQFNLRTIRYSEQDVQNMIDSDRFITMTVDLKDRFGEYGIICLVILEKVDENTAFLDTLIMSCRVLKRSVEEYVFNKIVDIAKLSGINTILGEYLPTKKNAMVKNLLEEYDFKLIENNEGATKWQLEVSEYSTKKTFVEENNE